MSHFEAPPRERAAWALRRVILRAAVDLTGTEIVQVRIEGMQTITTETLADPLAGVRAALITRDLAIAEIRKYAEQDRGAGRTWDEVGEALAIPAMADGERRDEQAYLLVVEGRLPNTDQDTGRWRRRAHWTCTSCQRWITDCGSFESHPDDVEQGHDATCARRATALAAFADGFE